MLQGGDASEPNVAEKEKGYSSSTKPALVAGLCVAGIVVIAAVIVGAWYVKSSATSAAGAQYTQGGQPGPPFYCTTMLHTVKLCSPCTFVPRYFGYAVLVSAHSLKWHHSIILDWH
jgi:hypothetical protein